VAEHLSSFTPHGWHTVTPRIFTGDVAGLVGFLKAVFDAGGEYREGVPAEIQIGDSIVLVSDGGGRRETMPAFLYVYVEDADETYRVAVAAGAQSVEKPIDTPYGDRRATVLDPLGQYLADRDAQDGLGLPGPTREASTRSNAS
jgi:uncharacterized glyoxalase superfamily protein PhnB